jgi:membrane protease subunit HflK
MALITVAIFVGRSSIYKIHEYERGLHLRGGRFISVQTPGWHFQIPLVDTVIIVRVNERLGYVEQISAMASDNVTMLVSLQYTYRVTDPQQFALQVDDPERIVFEFVQGRLRDVINTKKMDEVMNNRGVMNSEIMTALKEKETQYGVQFVTVQIQSASPPEEVLTAIKDRMVATQRQQQAEAEAVQKQTQADADLYAAQKQADAQAYQISTTAAAEAERIQLTTEAQQLAVRAILAELEGKGALGEKYVELLIAEQLQENSKWIISGSSTPIIDLRDASSAE